VAARPPFSALRSERGWPMRPVESALEEFVAERRQILGSLAA
jgi:hypothetical protein